MARVVLTLWVSAALMGCGGGHGSAAQESSNLKPLALLYGQYIGRHRGQPPPNESEFKQFIQKDGATLLATFAIADVDELFVSSRDQQPYVVLYGPTSGPPGPAGQPVIAYERDGVGGKRFVASSLGAVEEVDESKFREWVPSTN